MPWRRYARAGYHLLRGELQLARAELEAGLSVVTPGGHGAWHHLECLRLQVLVELGEHALAAQSGRSFEAAMQSIALRPVEPTQVAVALALAEAHGGELARGIERIEHALAEAQRGRHTGPSLAIGVLHETRARFARLQGDEDAFASHAERAAVHYRLLARYERLVERTQAGSPRQSTEASADLPARDAVTVSGDPRD